MESVFDSGARRTFTTAAGRGAAGETDEELPPVCPHPVAAIRQATARPSAVFSTAVAEDGLRIFKRTHFGPLSFRFHGQNTRESQRKFPPIVGIESKTNRCSKESRKRLVGGRRTVVKPAFRIKVNG